MKIEFKSRIRNLSPMRAAYDRFLFKILFTNKVLPTFVSSQKLYICALAWWILFNRNSLIVKTIFSKRKF